MIETLSKVADVEMQADALVPMQVEEPRFFFTFQVFLEADKDHAVECFTKQKWKPAVEWSVRDNTFFLKTTRKRTELTPRINDVTKNFQGKYKLSDNLEEQKWQRLAAGEAARSLARSLARRLGGRSLSRPPASSAKLRDP